MTGKDATLRIVGYPADIPPDARTSVPENSAGKIMCESSRTKTWDLDIINSGLKYRADTYGGKWLRPQVS